MKRAHSLVRAGARLIGLAVVWTAASPSPMWAQWSGTNPVWTNSNVGIGTTNPQTRGHIVKPYTNDGVGGTTGSDSPTWGTWGVYKSDMTFLLDTGGIRTANRGGGIGFSNGDGFVLGAIKGAAMNSNTGEFGGYLGFYTTGANSGGTAATGYERMRIDQNGNVGIGTTNPQTTLDVVQNGTYINFGARIQNLNGNSILNITGNSPYNTAEINFLNSAAAISTTNPMWRIGHSGTGGRMDFYQWNGR